MTDEMRMNVPKNYSGVYFSGQKIPPQRPAKTQKSTLVSRERPLPPPAPAEPSYPISEEKNEPEGKFSVKQLDVEELLLAGVIMLLLREGTSEFLPLALATLLL